MSKVDVKKDYEENFLESPEKSKITIVSDADIEEYAKNNFYKCSTCEYWFDGESDLDEDGECEKCR